MSHQGRSTDGPSFWMVVVDHQAKVFAVFGPLRRDVEWTKRVVCVVNPTLTKLGHYLKAAWVDQRCFDSLRLQSSEEKREITARRLEKIPFLFELGWGCFLFLMSTAKASVSIRFMSSSIN